MTQPQDTLDPHGLGAEFKAMVRLALPVVAVQCGLMFMGVVDTLMLGRVSADDLAAGALGNVYFYAAAIFGMGTLLALDPVIAQAVGAGDEAAVGRGVQRGVVLAVGMTLLASLLLLPAGPVLASLRQPESVVPGATAYSLISIAGMFPFYAFVVARQSLQAMKLVRPVVVAMVVANLANVALNYVFIFGKLGLPAMGVVGAAWATQISRWIMLVAALWGGWRFLAPHLTGWRRDTIRFEPLKRMLALGSPIGIQHLLEFGVFGVVGLMMGWIGPVAMAGHQVALNLASFTFMVPMGVSAAAAVLVGHAVGKGDAPEARRAALAGLACGLGFMALSAAGMLAAPGFFAGLYTDQPDVAAVAMSLIPVAGVFQLFDGAQVVSIGILRGAGDTRTPMVINVVGFWLLGLPVSLLLAFRVGLGSTGLWWGLVLGLAVVALLLLVRVRLKLAGRLDRVVIDREAVTASP